MRGGRAIGSLLHILETLNRKNTFYFYLLPLFFSFLPCASYRVLSLFFIPPSYLFLFFWVVELSKPSTIKLSPLLPRSVLPTFRTNLFIFIDFDNLKRRNMHRYYLDQNEHMDERV